MDSPSPSLSSPLPVSLSLSLVCTQTPLPLPLWFSALLYTKKTNKKKHFPIHMSDIVFENIHDAMKRTFPVTVISIVYNLVLHLQNSAIILLHGRNH